MKKFLLALVLCLLPSIASAATYYWRGDAAAVAQVVTITPSNVEIGDIFTVTMNNKSVSFTATAATVANVTAGLLSAIGAVGYAEFGEVTWSDQTSFLRGTASTQGKPFTASTSHTDGGGANTQDLVYAVSTASTGPNHWAEGDNWQATGGTFGTAPGTGDTAIFANSNVDCLYDLDQNAVTLASLQISRSYTGKLGLKTHSGTYFEYRDQYLKIGATSIRIGDGVGSGSPRLKIDTHSVQTSLTVSYTAAAESGSQASLFWKGTHASNAASVVKGYVGVGVLPGESATLATLRVGFVSDAASDAIVAIGDSATLTTVNQVGGTITSKSAVPTLETYAGETWLLHSATCTTANVRGGTLRHLSSGTITTVNMADGTLDFSQDTTARTVTNCLLTGGTINDPGRSVTWTNGIKLTQTSITDVTLDLGTHLTITPSAY